MPLNHDQILFSYNALFRRYADFYSFAHNYSKLISTLTHVLKGSCAKLLAAKFSLKSQAKVYKKFGPSLRSPTGTEFVKPKNGMNLKFNYKIKDNLQALIIR